MINNDIILKLTWLRDIYDEFFTQTNEQLKQLYEDIYEENIDIKIIEEFMNNNSDVICIQMQ